MSRYTGEKYPEDHNFPDPFPYPMGAAQVTRERGAKRTPWGLIIGVVMVMLLCVGVSIPMIMSASDDKGVSGQITLPVTTKSPAKGKAVPQRTPAPQSIKDGQWLVGEAVKAGTYATPGAAKGVILMCAWTVYDSEGGTPIDGGFSDKADSPGRVVLKKNQVFHTTGCKAWVFQPSGS